MGWNGGFAVAAAMAGADRVLALDRSEPALALAAEAADLNGVGETCRFQRADIFEMLERLAVDGERFDLVIADPPAFVKSKKDLGHPVHPWLPESAYLKAELLGLD